MNIRKASRLRGLVTIALVSALTSTLASVCAAGNSGDTVSQTVKYGDLDLSTPEGATALYRRIASAARNVCSARNMDTWNFAWRSQSTACVQKAIADAVTKVNQPALFLVYNENYKPSLPINLVSRAH
jgi:UrcA family protein